MNRRTVYNVGFIRGQEEYKQLLLEALQHDLENGAKWLNEIALDNFKSNYPQVYKLLNENTYN